MPQRLAPIGDRRYWRQIVAPVVGIEAITVSRALPMIQRLRRGPIFRQHLHAPTNSPYSGGWRATSRRRFRQLNGDVLFHDQPLWIC